LHAEPARIYGRGDRPVGRLYGIRGILPGKTASMKSGGGQS
jgi:hypothetical protein